MNTGEIKCRCIVAGCMNQKNEGLFGTPELCMPCFLMLSSGEIKNGETFIHQLKRKSDAEKDAGKKYKIIEIETVSDTEKGNEK